MVIVTRVSTYINIFFQLPQLFFLFCVAQVAGRRRRENLMVVAEDRTFMSFIIKYASFHLLAVLL